MFPVTHHRYPLPSPTVRWLTLTADWARRDQAIIGAVMPLVLRKLGADPVLASSIFLTTATNVASMALLLGLATRFFMMHPQANARGWTFRQYTEDPNTMFEAMLTFQR